MGNTHKTGETSEAKTPRNALILAVETSSRVGSVALASGSELLGQATFTAPMQHSAEIMPAIVELLHRSSRSPLNLEQVHISIGPGSFTGLRIAVAAAKAMHLANGTRIVAVDSLDAIAANVKDAPVDEAFQSISQESHILRLATLLDAKRGQFFTAVYEYQRQDHEPPPEDASDDRDYLIPAPAGGWWRKTLPDCLLTADELLDRFATPDYPLLVAGDGLLYHQDRFQGRAARILDERYWSPRAESVHLLGCRKAAAGRFSDPLTLVPFYLRGPEVTLRKSAHA
ncbi:MAG: tRNA (adenosine(37)-N6)-threonylcarbamoyltransferase complex dimerization subunit type 1 TsaB [Sedimentisphaerales bacterium]|jgi:tRNA threonylcarbamoyl adenosine modification protein YeaZ|nr:tRNA (adenosine(37)-N6)-threonylcarbamoyltransferase complex dimerization subunit type 1 TsaB [Sedimentisphaerales bacterium]HNY80238.1 tRNA (adenosine(37)-N6)-threonylcarbamoyltransferase complex dimerization subunit type 1 TsaB [Sedimentisphaerales bacterium]HOC63768.1 tRNA (adenosine(37)-N6)-threonylcarbamoyltransferase complex dimerization subunit type 1 TsaB [Sedimentisphaerales bacterium]HOH65910.1 tRNA (adenosine(37)-N6)-threonylcarbamoyltransferase complex dimerization subunit type 1 